MDVTNTVTPELHELAEAFGQRGFGLRLVGGCVRDLLADKTPGDVDLCTDANPDEAMAIYRDLGVRHIPTGLDHGTVTVVLNDETYEITSLREDVSTDGRRAVVRYTRDWAVDSNRRDFTINSMSMTLDGKLFDPFGGAEDLRAGRVRFVGNADTRIQEDYLRILRWYRFTARFGQEYDVDALAAVERQCKGLKSISVERIWSEVKQIIAGPRGISTLYDMWYVVGVGHSAGFPRGAPWYGHPQDPPFSVTTNPVTLMVYMWRHEIYGVLKNWKASREEIDLAQYLLQPDRDCKAKNPFREMAVHGVSREWAIEMAALQNLSAMEIAMLDAWTVPEFPVTGYDLIKMGMKPGPQYGVVINKLKEIWADSGYTATKEQLLANVQV
jgi:tRNA nucleotidyltransferase (CCA-adding enzyme)